MKNCILVEINDKGQNGYFSMHGVMPLMLPRNGKSLERSVMVVMHFLIKITLQRYGLVNHSFV